MCLRRGSRCTVCMFECKHTGSDWSERSFTSRVNGRLAVSKENRGGGVKGNSKATWKDSGMKQVCSHH